MAMVLKGEMQENKEKQKNQGGKMSCQEGMNNEGI